MQMAGETMACSFEPLVGLKRAAEALGIHSDTLKKKAQKGEVPAIKLGKYWRFRLSALDAWLESRLVWPQTEPRRVNREEVY